MGYKKDNKNKLTELDDMNIRSHLNTSLDLSGIHVSEDLIHRTLAAIKEQPARTAEEIREASSPTRQKAISWSRLMRGFATVAAALVIIVAAYAAMKQLPIGMKMEVADNTAAAPEMNSFDSDDNYTADDQDMGVASTESSADEKEYSLFSSQSEEGTGSTAEDQVTAPALADTQYTISAETFTGAAKKDSEAPKALDKANEKLSEKTSVAKENNDSNGSSEDNIIISSTSVTLSFQDIFIPTPEQAQYIVITDNINNTSINLTEPADIKEFYVVMENHQFKDITGDTATGDGYTVEMLDADTKAVYTMLVGDHLTVRFVQGEISTENTYDPVDSALFQEDLQSFYTAHQK